MKTSLVRFAFTALLASTLFLSGCFSYSSRGTSGTSTTTTTRVSTDTPRVSQSTTVVQ